MLAWNGKVEGCEFESEVILLVLDAIVMTGYRLVVDIEVAKCNVKILAAVHDIVGIEVGDTIDPSKPKLFLLVNERRVAAELIALQTVCCIIVVCLEGECVKADESLIGSHP